jgi:probable F420-dependent oxidoreductase
VPSADATGDPARQRLGRVGIWASRRHGRELLVGAARTAEAGGVGTFWLSGGAHPGVFDDARAVLDATTGIAVGLSVVNMWIDPAGAATEAYHVLEDAHPGRLWPSFGVSHQPIVESLGGRDGARQPSAQTMSSYLDELDGAVRPIPASRRMVGALGPIALRTAARRTAGSTPYLVPVEHTDAAREALGAGPFLAPEITVVVEDDPERGRAEALEFLGTYRRFPNYVDTWERFGVHEAALDSDPATLGRIVAVGPRQMVATAEAHLVAGADHVAVQVVGDAERLAEDVAVVAGLLAHV